MEEKSRGRGDPGRTSRILHFLLLHTSLPLFCRPIWRSQEPSNTCCSAISSHLQRFHHRIASKEEDIPPSAFFHLLPDEPPRQSIYLEPSVEGEEPLGRTPPRGPPRFITSGVSFDLLNIRKHFFQK